MVKATSRQRPGERNRRGIPENSIRYDLAADRRLRAHAAFCGLTLGHACKVNDPRMHADIDFRVTVGRNLLLPADTEHVVLSQREIELLIEIQDVKSGHARNPAHSSMVAEEIDLLLISDIEGKLVRARRARPTPGMLAEIKRQLASPDVRSLELSTINSWSIPY